MSDNAPQDNTHAVDKLYEEIERLSLPENIKKSSYKRTAMVILNIIYAIVVLFLLSALVMVQIAKENGKVPTVFGYTFFYVQTGSMEPTLPIGSVVLAKAVEDTASLSAGEDSIKDGDIVAYYDKAGTRITHRIESIVTLPDGEIAYRTRGDSINNATDEEVLTQDRIIAVVVRRVA